MLEYLGDVALKRVGIVHDPSEATTSMWLLGALFGVIIDDVDYEPVPWVMAATIDTGYLELARQMEVSKDFIDALWEPSGEIWPRLEHIYEFDLEKEICQRTKVVPEHLWYHGLGYSVLGGISEPLTGEDREAIRQVIRERVTPCTVWETYSYGLKHRIEEVLGYHVSNGDAIEAMILEGYRYKEEGGSNNCWFKACWIPKAPPMSSQ